LRGFDLGQQIGIIPNRNKETAMISGTHSIIYSTNPDADRAFFRDVLNLPHVNVGGGWLIFGLPPAEVALHPSDKNDLHEFYLMCDDIEALISEMTRRNLTCGPVQDQGWGMLTRLTLPGGGKLGIYQPRHARPKGMTAVKSAKKHFKRKAKKSVAPKKKSRSR
jgi:hypothetical protein